MPWEASVATAHEAEVVVPAPGRAPVRVMIWLVEVAGELYVRSWKGPDGVWYRRARAHGAGTVGGRPVTFVPVVDDPELEAAVDAAFRAKYPDSPYLDAMIRPPAAGTTLRLDPA